MPMKMGATTGTIRETMNPRTLAKRKWSASILVWRELQIQAADLIGYRKGTMPTLGKITQSWVRLGQFSCSIYRQGKPQCPSRTQ